MSTGVGGRGMSPGVGDRGMSPGVGGRGMSAGAERGTGTLLGCLFFHFFRAFLPPGFCRFRALFVVPFFAFAKRVPSALPTSRMIRNRGRVHFILLSKGWVYDFVINI